MKTEMVEYDPESISKSSKRSMKSDGSCKRSNSPAAIPVICSTPMILDSNERIVQQEESPDSEPSNSSELTTLYVNHVKAAYPTPLKQQPVVICSTANELIQTQPYVWFKKPFGSNLDYRVLDFNRIPGSYYYVVIEIPVNDGVICGTSLTLTDLCKNSVKLEMQDSNLTLNTYQGSHIFERSSNEEIFDVKVASHIGHLTSQITMESLTEHHWQKMRDMIIAGSFFQQIMSFEDLTTGEKDTEDKFVYKKLAVSCTSSYYFKKVTAGIEALSLFQELCIEDQLIILKEGAFAAGFLFFTHNFVKDDNSFVLNSVLGDSLLMCLHLDSKKEEFNGEVYHVFKTFLADFPDFLRLDIIVITMLSLLIIFEDEPGLSGESEVQKERCLYEELLDKYFDAKLKIGYWQLDKSNLWNHINQAMEYVVHAKKIYIAHLKHVYDRDSQYNK